MSEEIKRLYRSRRNRMFSGLCAGLGEYVGIDPTVIRLIFAIGSVFFFPFPIVIYLIMMLVVPEAPALPPTEIL